MAQMAGRLPERVLHPIRPEALRGPAGQVLWFAAIAALAFAVPYVFTSTMDLDHDVYYLVYFVLAGAALAAYVEFTDFDLGGFVRQNLTLSLAIGALSTAFVVWNVLARNDATPRPANDLYFAFEIGWRGVVYGVVDALLLTAFPGMVAFALMNRDVRGLARRVKFAALALPMILVVTGVYHLGYEQFRDDGIGAPELGNTVISAPLLLAVNPVGSVIAHASMHVAAVTHAYETEVFLPPQTDAD